MFRAVSLYRGTMFALLGGMVLRSEALAQNAVVTVTPSADTFVRAAAPSGNYGGAGAIAVSGAAATNANGQVNGVFDSLVRFPASNLVASLDSAIGSHDWIVIRAILHLTEMGAPPSPLFNRGVGQFEVRWISNDNWIEGSGIPAQPTTDGVKYQDLPSILNPATDASLGQFTNSGADGPLSFQLALMPQFVADVRSGGEVGFYLRAVSSQIGFTIESRTYFVPAEWPTLEIMAAANPNARIYSIVKSGSGEVTIGFGNVSNWTTTLQTADNLSFNDASNLLTIPAQPTSVHTNFVDGVTESGRFYRLVLSQ